MRDHFQTRFNTVSDTRFGLSLSLGTHADMFCPGGLFDRASLPTRSPSISTEVAGGLAHNVNAWMSVVNCDINVE